MNVLRLTVASISCLCALTGCSGRSDRTPDAKADPAQAAAGKGHAQNIKYDTMQWTPFAPSIGADSPEFTMLHVDSATGATKLMIRVPSGFTVPAHWHSANETHTVVRGAFIMECEGVRDTLTTGSFNYIPKRMPHRAWTLDNEGALLFITVDGPWDVNFVDGTPDWPKLRKPGLAGRGI